MNLFKTNGYTNISSFFSGKDAIENIKLEKPHLALLGIKDEISWLEVAVLLKKLNIPFIFISAFSDNLNYEKALKLNPAHIFIKSDNHPSLLRAVETTLNAISDQYLN